MGSIARKWAMPIASASVLVAAGALLASGAAAQDAGVTWGNETELSFVAAGDNASATTLGAKTLLTATSGPNLFKIEGSAIRGETTTTTRTATGTATDFTVSKTTNSALTAESYFVRGRFDRDFQVAYAFASGGWDRNTFAGVRNRYSSAAGIGRTWVDTDTTRFKLDFSATYTIQKDVEPAPGVDDAFPGVRLGLDAKRRFAPSFEYATVLLADENLDDTEDFRADWTHSATVNVTGAVGFKTSLQLLYDHQPALLSVPLEGAPAGTTVLTPGEKLDTVLTIALLISF